MIGINTWLCGEFIRMEADMLSTFKNYLALALAYVRINLNAQIEYRGAFLSEAIAMFINDGFWLGVLDAVLSRFPVLRGWNA